jgi:hypothetical protein
MSVSFHENRESTREIAGEADSARKEATPNEGQAPSQATLSITTNIS